MTSWIWLCLAIVLEVCGTTSMKFSAGFTRLGPSLMIFVFYVLCFTCLTLAVKSLELSLAYAIWSGVGTVLITLIGVVFFGESISWLKVGCIALIIVGALGLKLERPAGSTPSSD